jgi:HPt (histidine-containing phosphotransfer) domain-containing protein
MSKYQIPEEILHLLPGYLERRRADILALTNSLSEKNYSKCAHIGHSIKGSGASFGLMKMSEIGRSIEMASATESSSQIAECIVALESELQDAFKHLGLHQA